MFKTRKTSPRPLQVLTSEELESVAGGAKETQLFSMLSDAVNEVMKSFGSALQAAARRG